MSDPSTHEWWSSQIGALIGAIGGGGLGSLAGLLGAAAGSLAPQGKARGVVLGTFSALIALGVALASGGLSALLVGQPRHVWMPLLLIGGVLTLVLIPLRPIVKKRYAEAEARRLHSEEFRRSG